MKKRICSAIIVLITLLFFGCGLNNYERNFSKNVSNYTMNITLSDDKTAIVSQSVEYKNNSNDTLNKICFHLYPEAFRKDVANKPVGSLTSAKAYPNGESYGGIDITSLKVNDETISTEFTGTDKDILVVNLKKPLLSKGLCLINFEYTLTLPNINHRFGYGDNAINLGNFYPVACVYENGKFSTEPYSPNGDPFYSDISNYNVTINYPKDYFLASTGNVISNTESDNTKSTKMSASAVRDFAIVLSTKFNVISKPAGKTMVNYYYYKDETPEKSLQCGIDSITTFEKLFGDYPYSQFSVVETNFVHGGMEYPNLVMISDNIDNYNDYLNTIVHETAHQWWYGLVGSDQFSYGWLDEGLTEYSTALFYKYNEGYEFNYQEIIKNAEKSYNLFIEVYTEVFGNVDTTMNRKLNEYKTEPEYVYISYVKGMILFDDVSKLIGEKRLITGLSTYFHTYVGQNVTPNDLIKTLEKSTHRKVSKIFDSYINGKTIQFSVNNE